MNIEKLKAKLKENMTIDDVVNKRYHHSVGVAEAAASLVIKHNLSIDLDKAYVAGLLHDATKLLPLNLQKEMLIRSGYKEDDEIMKSKNVWHGETAPSYVKNVYEIDDEEILNAIKYHVMGRPTMNDLEKVVFVADYIEKNRVGEVFDNARKIAFVNLDDAILYILSSQIKYITSKGEYLVSQTLKTYEYYKGEKES